jgi:hypothetical protein
VARLAPLGSCRNRRTTGAYGGDNEAPIRAGPELEADGRSIALR